MNIRIAAHPAIEALIDLSDGRPAKPALVYRLMYHRVVVELVIKDNGDNTFSGLAPSALS